MIGARGTVHGSEQKRDSYFKRHWRGEINLAQSFWLNLIAVNFLFAVVFGFSTPWLGGSGAFPLLAIFFAAFLVWLWGAVGSWRSADQYQSHSNAKIWGRLAQAVIVLHALSWFVQGKDLFENAAVAPAAQTSTLSDQSESTAANQSIEVGKNVQAERGEGEWSAFETKQFEGVSISVPRGWRWMGEADNDALNTASEAMGDEVGFPTAQGNNRVLAAGNAFDDAKVSVETIRLSERSAAPTISQSDLRQALAEPQEAVRSEIVGQGQVVAEGMRRAPQTTYYENPILPMGLLDRFANLSFNGNSGEQ